MRNNVFAYQIKNDSMIQTAQSDCKLKKYEILIIKIFIFNYGYVNIRINRSNNYYFQFMYYRSKPMKYIKITVFGEGR